MRRLVCSFAGRTYDIVGNLTHWFISFCVDMHLIDAKCNKCIITSLFHFASTLATQNVIKKNQNVIIITLLQNVLQQCPPPPRKHPLWVQLWYLYLQSGKRRLIMLRCQSLRCRAAVKPLTEFARSVTVLTNWKYLNNLEEAK